MNADLHMSEELKNTGIGNLFVIFGEPDIDLLHENDGKLRVKVNGVDVFKPQTGEVISDVADGITCWFIDTDYNEESFFVRHAYFLGANDPYSALKTTLKAEIDPDAWATLNSDTSRPFRQSFAHQFAAHWNQARVISDNQNAIDMWFLYSRPWFRVPSTLNERRSTGCIISLSADAVRFHAIDTHWRQRLFHACYRARSSCKSFQRRNAATCSCDASHDHDDGKCGPERDQAVPG